MTGIPKNVMPVNVNQPLFYCPHKMQKRQILQNACRKVYEICSGLSISMSRMVWDMDPYGEWNGQIKGIDDYYYVLKNTG